MQPIETLLNVIDPRAAVAVYTHLLLVLKKLHCLFIVYVAAAFTLIYIIINLLVVVVLVLFACLFCCVVFYVSVFFLN